MLDGLNENCSKILKDCREGRICGSYIPHAGQQLHQTAISKGKGDNDVGFEHISGLDVDEGQDEGGQGEGTQPQRGRIGNLAVGGGFVQTRLELSSKGGEPCRLASVEVGEGVATVVAIDGSTILPIDAGCCGRGGGFVGLKSMVGGLGSHGGLLILLLARKLGS